jgi:hypothetical protein
MERKGGTFTLPMVTETRMTRTRRRLRRIEMVRTFLGVIIFIFKSLAEITRSVRIVEPVRLVGKFRQANAELLFTLSTI